MKRSAPGFGSPRRAWFELLLGTVALATPLSALASEVRFRVIVHPSNPFGAVSRDFLADAFLKKVTRWEDAEAMHPVDQRADAAARRSFSDDVLKRSVSAVKIYWQQRIFSSRGVPPPELDSERAVVEYVASHRGGVGYVSEAAKLDAVKV